ncbi:hypothetical protein C1O63_0261 [Dehalococcoides mccartyi]|nr:hypothetical protein C1O63_0261 [Dehalococcoides mccartyi]
MCIPVICLGKAQSAGITYIIKNIFAGLKGIYFLSVRCLNLGWMGKIT